MSGGDPPRAPEVAVECAGVAILDGNATPSVTDGTSFANASQYGPGTSRTYTVRNTGTATLTLGGVSVPEGFAVTEELSGSLAAGESDIFTVQLLTTAAGTFGGEITFATNDSDENPFNFQIAGVVAAPSQPNLTILTTSLLGESLGGFNADGSKIAYAQWPQQPWYAFEVWTMNADGSAKHPITNGYGGTNPVFLPDGRISYVRHVSSTDSDIWIVNADGTGAHLLLGGPLEQGEHSWAPNGKKFVYAGQYASGVSEIWAAKADGTGLVRLTSHSVDGLSQSHPVYSRSGASIAYVNQTAADPDGHVWIMRSNGRGKKQVTFGPGGDVPVFWWPGDSALGYIHTDSTGHSGLWLKHMASGAATPLIDLPNGEIFSADLSRAGNGLALTMSDASGTHVWTFDGKLFGGKLKALWTEGDGDRATLSLAGPGVGMVLGAASDVIVMGTTGKSRLNLKATKTGGGDGLVAIGDVTVQGGSLGGMSAKAATLNGTISIPGTAGNIVLGNVAEGKITADGIDAKGLSIRSLKAGRVSDLTVLVPGGVQSISVADWLDGSLSAGWVGSVATKANAKTGSLGHFGADVTLSGSASPAGKAILGTARIAGDLLSNTTWDLQSGAAGKITVAGTARQSMIRSGGDIKSISLGASDGSDFAAGLTLDLLKSNRHAIAGDPANAPTGTIASFAIKGLKTPAGQAKPRFFIDSDISAAGAKVKILNWDGLGGLFAPAGSLNAVTLKETEPGYLYTSDDFIHLV
jgi:hypothetical protein